jgi:CBS domain containing-hemolysin-like protein
MTLFVLAIAIALGVSFCCNLLEACLLSLSMADIAGVSEKRPLAGTIWRGFKDNIQKPIAVILIVNTFAHTIGASVSGGMFQKLFGSTWLGVYSIVFSMVMIQWTEMLPKTWGVRYNRAVASMVAVPMRLVVLAFSPLVSIMEALNRPFYGRQTERTSPDALNEIGLLTRFATINKMITKEQQDIVSRSIKLSNALVRDIMVDRGDIKCLSSDMSMIDALVEAHLHHHTRYILIRGNDRDQVLGYVNVKDIVSALQLNPSNPSLVGIARPVQEVGVGQKVTAILSSLTKGYQHIAIVKDEKGKTAGLITMEDIVEAIVGDIEDEYDLVPSYVHKLSEARFLVGGGVTMSKLREITGFDIPDVPLPLSEWMGQKFPKTPTVEMKFQYEDLLLIVRKVRRSKIHEAIVEQRQLLEKAAADSAKGV